MVAESQPSEMQCIQRDIEEGTPLYEMVPISYNMLLAEKEFV